MKYFHSETTLDNGDLINMATKTSLVAVALHVHFKKWRFGNFLPLRTSPVYIRSLFPVLPSFRQRLLTRQHASKCVRHI